MAARLAQWVARTVTAANQNKMTLKAFLRNKWSREADYKLKKELWAFTGNRISVAFFYEWQDAATGQWFRSHGNEQWEFDRDGLMARRESSVNDMPIKAEERRL